MTTQTKNPHLSHGKADSKRTSIYSLTPAEQAVYALYSQGMSAKEIAARLDRTVRGVTSRISVIREKMALVDN